MRTLLLCIAIATSTIISGCATRTPSREYSTNDPEVRKVIQGKFVKAVPAKYTGNAGKDIGLVGGTADVVGMNTSGGLLGGLALGISLLDAASGPGEEQGREIHLLDEATNEPITFNLPKFVATPAVGDVVRWVYFKDGQSMYTNITLRNSSSK